MKNASQLINEMAGIKMSGSGEACPYCGEALQECSKTLGGRFLVWLAPCQCQQAQAEWHHKNDMEFKAEVAAIEQRNRAEYLQRVKDNCGLGLRFRDRTFENYQRDSQPQEKLYQTAKAYTKAFNNRKTDGLGLYMTGNYGTGKTHIAAAIAHELLNSGVKVIFKTSSSLLQDIRQKTIQKGQGEVDVIEHYSKVDLLVIDDLGKEKATEWSVSTLASIINNRYEDCKPVIITANYSLNGLTGVLTPPGGDGSTARSITSRLAEMCQVLTLDWQDRRQNPRHFRQDQKSQDIFSDDVFKVN